MAILLFEPYFTTIFSIMGTEGIFFDQCPDFSGVTAEFAVSVTLLRCWLHLSVVEKLKSPRIMRDVNICNKIMLVLDKVHI